MHIRRNQINRYRKIVEGTLLIILVILPLTVLSGSDASLYEYQQASNGITNDILPTEITYSVLEEKNFIGNYSFDLESLADYIDSLYDTTQAIFFESVDGFSTSIATYEALAVLRIFGLDYYQFFSKWQDYEVAIAEKLVIDLEDEGGSGGFRLSQIVSNPSLEGTFGVANALWLMNQLTLQLKGKSHGIMNYTIRDTFDKSEFGFHEEGQEPTLKSTFQALSILDLVYKVVLEVQDLTTTPVVNQTIWDFMTNYSINIFNFIESFLVENTYFHDNTSSNSPIEETWYALQAISVLEQFSTLFGISLPKNLIDYQSQIQTWLPSFLKTTGVTKGGYGFSESATTKETGIIYAISHLLNITNDIDHIGALNFVNSSQFLKRENRTYITAEVIDIGGFGPNNLSHSQPEVNNRVNIHDTYYSSLVYLLSLSVFESINLDLETAYYQQNQLINRSNYIIQGEVTSINLGMKTFDYKSHGSLSLTTTIDNWEITHPSYSETNEAFTRESSAIYKVNIENDSNGDFNWTLGSHKIVNHLSIRNFPVIQSPVYLQNSTIIVGYAPMYDFGTTLIKPGFTVNATIYYQNRSVITYETLNVTEGSLSANLTSPNSQVVNLLSHEPLNITTNSFQFKIPFTNQSLLGTWDLSLRYNNSLSYLATYFPLEISDVVRLVNISKVPVYYPGNPMNLNVSLEYSNGYFTPKANASLLFISNETHIETFNVELSHSSGNVYTSIDQTCPIQFLSGFYNLSVKLSWNVSSTYQIIKVANSTLTDIQIGGTPILYQSAFATDHRGNLTLSDSYTVFYGESLNMTFEIGINTPSGTYNITDSEVDVIGGIVNVSEEVVFLQRFKMVQVNESIFMSGSINPNFVKTTFGTRFKIKSDWNKSYVYLRNPTNPSININYGIALSGDFSITNTQYYGTNKQGDYHVYAIDTSSVITISFEVINSEFNNIPVPNINLYGILDIEGKPGRLNQSLPSITSAIGDSDTHLYLLSIPPANLASNTYEITVYSTTGISPNLKIGTLSPGFKVVSTLTPSPIIQLHEALILIMVITFIGLVYLNLKRNS
ncbi:MAG: hypothetical protein ACW99R_12810 [Candidatus Hodarchaeales archaeon]